MHKPPLFVVTPELSALAKSLADWAVPAPGTVIYLYGSRVRGHHKPSSDIDICVDFPKPAASDIEWWTKNNQDNFESISNQVGARIEILEPNSPIRSKVTSAPIVHQDRNVRCVWSPPHTKPKKQA